jgi:hypothetical protein
MTDVRDRDEDAASTAEREGIVDQQDAALSAIEEIEDTGDDDPMQGEAPTG